MVFELLPDSLGLLGDEGFLLVDSIKEFILLSVHECACLQHGLLHILDLHLILRSQGLDLISELFGQSFESCDFDAFLVVGVSKLLLLLVVCFLKSVNLLVEIIDFGVQAVSFLLPIVCLLLLPIKPAVVLFLQLIILILQLLHVSLVQSQHLLHLQVQRFYLLVLRLYLSLQSALLVHDLLHVQIASLEELVVGDVGERSLGGMSFDFFVSLGNH